MKNKLLKAIQSEKKHPRIIIDEEAMNFIDVFQRQEQWTVQEDVQNRVIYF